MSNRPSGKKMLIDTSICMACRGCQVACKDWHQLPAETTTFTGTYENPPDLSGITFTRIRFVEIADGAVKWLFFKDQCRHCVNPHCKKGCPVPGAIVKEPSGAVVFTDACNPTLCGTRPCEQLCPYNIPRLNAQLNKEKKCDLCFDRIAYGKPPMCTQTCPPGAITFGNTADVQYMADQRLAEVQRDYFQANIYPRHGKGGGGQTCVIWLLIHTPAAYGIG